MYAILKNIHSYWAFLVLLILVLAVANAFRGMGAKKEFENKDLRISLFGLIFSHIQLLIGLILYFVSPWFDQWEMGMGSVMKGCASPLISCRTSIHKYFSHRLNHLRMVFT